MRIEGGFRMGPFELMDLVGVDTGLEISKSFYEQSFGEPRWRPSPITARYVAAGLLRPQERARLLRLLERSLPPPGPGSGSTRPRRRRGAARGRRRARADRLPGDQRVRLRARRRRRQRAGHRHRHGARAQLSARTARVGRSRSGSTTCWPCWMASGRSTARSATAPRRRYAASCAPAGWDGRAAPASSPTTPPPEPRPRSRPAPTAPRPSRRPASPPGSAPAACRAGTTRRRAPPGSPSPPR